MKNKNLVILGLVALSLSACVKVNVKTNSPKDETIVAETKKDVVETAASPHVENTSSKSSYRKNENVAGSFNYKNLFKYTGDDKYLGAICDDIVNDVGPMYHPDDKKTIEIPSPYIAKIDDSDKNDIKVYGDFWVYGYALDGTTFVFENGGSYPGCYHLKEEDGKVSFVSKEIADDGSNFDSSLKKICGDDEELYKKIMAKDEAKDKQNRIDYVKMYAKDNNLKITSIKDYGWPIIIFDDVADAEFVYLFYKSYFDEVRQEDVLNDMEDRIENLKKAYMTSDLIAKKDEETMDAGADMIISAQDVTDDMYNTLFVEDKGNGDLFVQYNGGGDAPTLLEVKKSGNKLTDIKVVNP